jgi:hypothetical protein
VTSNYRASMCAMRNCVCAAANIKHDGCRVPLGAISDANCCFSLALSKSSLTTFLESFSSPIAGAARGHRADDRNSALMGRVCSVDFYGFERNSRPTRENLSPRRSRCSWLLPLIIGMIVMRG